MLTSNLQPPTVSDLDEARRALDACSDSMEGVQLQIAAATESLSNGRPPDDDLIRELTNVRSAFLEVQSTIDQLASRSLGGGVAGDTPPSIRGLREKLDRVVAAEAERTGAEQRRGALGVVERALSIVSATEQDAPDLTEVFAQAMQLRVDLETLPWGEISGMAESLATGEHPLASFLALVGGSDGLDDAAWERCADRVRDAYSQRLATAAMRGRYALMDPLPDSTSMVDNGSILMEHGLDGTPQPTDASTEPSDRRDLVVQHPDDERPAADTEANSAREANAITVESNVAEPAEGAAEDGQGGAALMPRDRVEDESAITIDSSPPRDNAVGPVSEPEGDDGRDDDSSGEVVVGNGAAVSVVEDGGFDHGTETHVEAGSQGDLLAHLLSAGRFGLAFHLAQSTESIAADGLDGRLGLEAPAWLIRAVALGMRIRYDMGESAAILRLDFQRFVNEPSRLGDAAESRAIKLLLIAASMRPTLLAPSTGAASVMDEVNIDDGLSGFSELVRAIATFGHGGSAIDAQALKRVKAMANWEAERDELRREVEAWQAQAPTRSVLYSAATDVWRTWTEPNGVLFNLLRPIREDDVAALERVAEEVRRLSDETKFRDLVDETDRRIGKRTKREKIRYNAYVQLRRHERKAVEFATRWLALQEARPSRDHGQHAQAERLREKIWEHLQEVRSELAALLQESRERGDGAVLLLVAATEVCQLAVEDIGRLFDPDVPLDAAEPAVRHVLHADLLRIPALTLGATWEPVDRAETIRNAVVDASRIGLASWTAAFRQRLEDRDHESTEHIIDFLGAHPHEAKGLGLDGLRQERARHLADCRQALIADVEATSHEIERTTMLGLLEESDRLSLIDRVERFQSLAGEMLAFAPAHRELNDVRAELAGRRSSLVTSVEARLASEEVRSRLEARAKDGERIRSVLRNGDAPTANEYIDMVLSGMALPEAPAAQNVFLTFLTEYDAIYQRLEPDDTLAVLVQRRPIKNETARDDARSKPAATRNGRADDLLRDWYTARNQRAFSPAGIQSVLDQLGFPNPRVNRRAGGSTFEVQTDLIADRERCPVPAYGSVANGRYRVFISGNQPTEDDLLDNIGETSRGAPLIVFHLGPLPLKWRRVFAHRCRQRGRTVIVLDDVLVEFLAESSGARLANFLACALPFTTNNPYTTTASLVPPEMFYGRAWERQSIEDRFGSCFIYGGRQLGKTALLRDIARSFHEPVQGRVAAWVDLKVEGIGFDRPIDDIWRLIGLQFKQLGVFKQTISDPDRLQTAVLGWLNDDAERRILLLLDEADVFLESDGQDDFVRIARLKGVMDRSERRFKVVFAGLHNVQRTARAENQPLAHYGEPVRIGPLYERNEWRNARALIERPLSSLGFQFENPDVITRILSRTNYFFRA